MFLCAAEIGRALATSERIAKKDFTGETATGRRIMQPRRQSGSRLVLFRDFLVR